MKEVVARLDGIRSGGHGKSILSIRACRLCCRVNRSKVVHRVPCVGIRSEGILVWTVENHCKSRWNRPQPNHQRVHLVCSIRTNKGSSVAGFLVYGEESGRDKEPYARGISASLSGTVDGVLGAMGVCGVGQSVGCLQTIFGLE